MFFSSSPLLFFSLNTFGIGKSSIDFEFIELLTNGYLDTQQKRAIEKSVVEKLRNLNINTLKTWAKHYRNQ